ncbi:MAG: tetratricopeptide repeat protein [Dokdonella sp.]
MKNASRSARGILILAAMLSGSAFAEPWHPANDNEVIEHIPAGAPRGLALTKSGTREQALAAARANISLGRRYSDPRYYGYAEAELAPWNQKAEDANPSREEVNRANDLDVLNAQILQFRHEFDAARNVLQTVLKRDRDNTQAWLTLAVIDQVQGDYRAARGACGHLVTAGDMLVASACAGGVGGLNGQADISATLIERELARGDASPAPVRDWAWTVLGEIRARQGQLDAAVVALKKALEVDQDDVYARAALADVLLDQGKPADVLVLIGDRRNADALLLRAAIAAKQSGNSEADTLRAAFAERVAEMNARGDATHRRELARFALEVEGDATSALDLALQNWAVQKEPADSWLVLAAAKAAGKPDAAIAVRQWIIDNKLEDVKIHALMEQLQ